MYNLTVPYLEYLKNLITSERFDTIEDVVSKRTRHIAVVLEDVFHSQNASALLRTCDCLGIQNVYTIENNSVFSVNQEIAKGSSKWLTIERFNKQIDNKYSAVSSLKKIGYRIVATSPTLGNIKFEDFPICKTKTAIIFGNELNGVSDELINMADECLSIPMFGFTESYNISVCAGIILFHLSSALRNSNIEWKLTEQESLALKIEFIKKSIKKPELIEEAFHSRKHKIDM
jgi:tRNA (guanosine-2'-O-)-methyltransferase